MELNDQLLCRRVDLLRARGLPVEAFERPMLRHVESCKRCQGAVALDQAVSEALCRSAHALAFPPGLRMRVLSRVRDQSRASGRSVSASVLASVAVAVVAGIALIAAGLAHTAQSTEPTVTEGPTRLEGEPFSGAYDLVARHAPILVRGATGVLPEGALVTAQRLPVALAERVGRDALRPTVGEASLYVLDQSRLDVDPLVLARLQSDGRWDATVTIEAQALRMTLASREGKLWVVVSDGPTESLVASW